MKQEEYLINNHRNLIKQVIVDYKFIILANKQLGEQSKLEIQYDEFCSNEVKGSVLDLIWSSVPGAVCGNKIVNSNVLENIVFEYFEGKITINQCMDNLYDFVEFGIKRTHH